MHTRNLIREPILHFVAAGALLLAGIELANPHASKATAAMDEEITVSAEHITALREDWARRHGREPDALELDRLVEDLVNTEVLYREARALGLDVGDLVVRRRLAQKMRFLLEGTAPLREPGDDELQAYLDSHRERFDLPGRYRISHVFVSHDLRGPSAREDAEALHAAMVSEATPAADAAVIGDPFPEGRDLPPLTSKRLAGMFGEGFAAALEELPAGEWSTPIASSYGYHLVWVHERQLAQPARLSEVRGRVESAWTNEQREAATAARLETLRQRYRVSMPAESTTSASLAEKSRL